MLMGPGSASRHYVPRRVRDTMRSCAARMRDRGQPGFLVPRTRRSALCGATLSRGPSCSRAHGSRLCVASLRAAPRLGREAVAGLRWAALLAQLGPVIQPFANLALEAAVGRIVKGLTSHRV